MSKFIVIIIALSGCLALPASAQVASSAQTTDRVLVVGTKEAPPFAMKSPDGTWTGMSIELWRRVADQMHLHYRFSEVSLQELIDGTAAGRLDAAIAAISVTAAREKSVDFTQPYFTAGLEIAVPLSAKFDWTRLIASLLSIGFVEALVGVIGVTILIGLTLWLLERRHTEHFQGRKTGLVRSVFWSASTIAQATPEHQPATIAGQIVALGWIAASTLAIAVFTAGITSQLTAKQLQGTVHGLDDLHGVRVGAVANTASLDFLTHERIRYRTYPTPTDGLNAVKAGTIDAFVYDRPILAWLARTDYSFSIQVLDAVFDKENYAIALPEGSTMRGPMNVAILEQTTSEWWSDLNTKYFGSE